MVNKTLEIVKYLKNINYYDSKEPYSDIIRYPNKTNSEREALLDDLYKQAMKMSTSEPFHPSELHNRVRRDGGYGHGCKRSGLGIFNFLLFLVVLLGLLNSLLANAMGMIMINGENVSLLQVSCQYPLLFHSTQEQIPNLANSKVSP